MKVLALQYVPPDKEQLQQAYEQGKITIGPAGAASVLQLIIKNYIDPRIR